ncbi:hypothetical protein POF50_026085 [Streptomyces sp. SL13]|uniref:Uncharacterized protein n=1 Tax=Streptantibioticus silvisoli TaxID=2705255 RepID=A0AA90HBT5_9ACTN|nr:hypothetical protein [Streptantibioticus silvisoli]MDI5972770.1 hypothetical protein [Streptantibioticus silvisoli]
MPRRRRFEPSGLFAGLIFLAVAAAFACDVAGVWHPKPLATVPFVCLGLAVVSVLRAASNRSRRRADSADQADSAGRG